VHHCAIIAIQVGVSASHKKDQMKADEPIQVKCFTGAYKFQVKSVCELN